MALSQTSVLKLYNTVIEDVISGVREAFLDEGVDEQVLQELKQIWETKLMASKAVELNPEPPEPQPPQLSKNSSSSKGGSKRNSNAQANAQPQTKEPTPPRPQPQPPQQAPAPQTTHAPTQQTQHQPQQQNQSQQIQQSQPQQGQHMQNMPVQQQMQQHHHQSLPQTQLQQPQQPHVNQQAAAVPTDRQISIQIKLPVHGQLPERLITVHVPASAVQGNQLHALFTGPIISAAIALPTPFATSLLQQHVNSTFEGVPGFTPVQVQPVQVVEQGANNIMQQQLIQGQAHGNMAQLDGAMDVDVRRGGSRNNVIPNKTIQIKLPAQEQLHLPERLVVVQVPSTIVHGNQLQKLFTDTIIAAATMLPVLYATNFLQHYVNSVVTVPSYTQAQAQPLQAVQQQFYQEQAHGSMAQLDGAAHDSLDNDDMVVEENSCCSNETQMIAIKIKLPAYNQKPERVVTLHYPASTANETKESVLHQLQEVSSGSAITAALELPSCSTSSFFQLVNSQLAGIIQLDGPGNDSSDDDDDEEEEDNDEDDDPDEDREEEDDENDDSGAREEEPLNSEDDVTDEDPTDLFDTDNVVVCQYDKITRSRNKWKFYLKDGIMNLSGKDFVFQKANGDAEW